MTKNTTGVIFLSGAGLDESIWNEVTNKLTVPYIVADYTEIRKNQNTGLVEYVQAAYDAAMSLGTEKIIIVAHSIGGVVGVELARRLGDKVGGFLGVSAAIPRPSKNFFSSLPVPQRFIMPIIVQLAGTKVPASAIRKGLCNGLKEDRIRSIIESFQPESKKLYFDKTSSSPLPNTRYAYIRTTDDKQFGIAAEDAMIVNLPNPIVTDVKSGHLSMIPHSREVADALNNLIRN